MLHCVIRPMCGLVILLQASLIGAPAMAADMKSHRIVIQVDSEDPAVMNMALNNAMNAKKAYNDKGETLTLEIVAYGPGITMLRSDTSPVKDRVDALKSAIPDATLSMCNNTKMAMEKREGKTIIPLPGVQIVPAGIVRIVELQEQGYSYVRP